MVIIRGVIFTKCSRSPFCQAMAILTRIQTDNPAKDKTNQMPYTALARRLRHSYVQLGPTEVSSSAAYALISVSRSKLFKILGGGGGGGPEIGVPVWHPHKQDYSMLGSRSGYWLKLPCCRDGGQPQLYPLRHILHICRVEIFWLLKPYFTESPVKG